MKKRYSILDLLFCYLRYLLLIIIMLSLALMFLILVPKQNTIEHKASFDIVVNNYKIDEWYSDQIEGIIISEISLQEYANALNTIQDGSELSSRDLRNLTCEKIIMQNGYSKFRVTVSLPSGIINEDDCEIIGQLIISIITDSFDIDFGLSYDRNSIEIYEIQTNDGRINFTGFFVFALLSIILPVVLDRNDPKLYTAYAEGADLVFHNKSMNVDKNNALIYGISEYEDIFYKYSSKITIYKNGIVKSFFPFCFIKTKR